MSRVTTGLAAAWFLATAGVAFAQAPPAAQRPAPDLSPRLGHAANRIASINAQADRMADYDSRNLQADLRFLLRQGALQDQVIDLFADEPRFSRAARTVPGKTNIRRYSLA
jgi:hypothetical protein